MRFDTPYRPSAATRGRTREGTCSSRLRDERWTLARVQAVIRRRLRVSLSVATVWRLLKTGTAGPGRHQPAEHSSVTSTRWSRGRRRCGRG
ncbi:winged helix-turn-helix domain-containing protein [Streptomyces sanglieri]|uniref:Winged helix-turn-helix domain-containing protein n=1 Tax=Streptomyces sanglieri TaxID=193460 RepID=A0ABW2X6N1_9ACTN